MTVKISLRTLSDLTGIRVNDEWIQTSIDLSELHANNLSVSEYTRFQYPKEVLIRGKESEIPVYITKFDRNDDGDCVAVIYRSLERVWTRSGKKRVSLTVWND